MALRIALFFLFFGFTLPASAQVRVSGVVTTFSMVGYEELNLPIKRIQQEELRVFRLSEKPSLMNEVSVSVGRLVEKSFGIRNNRALIHLLDGSTKRDDIFEIAQFSRSQ